MFALAVAAAVLAPQSATTYYINARLIPISGPEIAQGAFAIKDGKFVAVGNMASMAIPAGASTIDLKGATVMPGLVDTHSHVGGGSGGDSSAPIAPEARIYDSINVRDTGFRAAAAGGLTTINIMPGSGHLMSGQTIYVKNRRDAKTIDDLAIRDTDGWIFGGLKMANGTNPLDAPPFPGTRAKSMALIRQKFIDAIAYRDEWRAYRAARDKGEDVKPPKRDIGMDAMVEALDGRRIVHHHTHRADDIISVLRMKEEFGFRVVLQHVSEAAKVADEIAAAKVPCSMIVIDAPGGKQEAVNLTLETGAALERAGVEVGFHTDDGITDSRLLLRSAGLSVRAGMSRPAALYALTLAGAKMMGLEARIGTLEVGKDADFIVLNGDPLSVYTKVQQTFVEGKRVFDRNDPGDRLYAAGGFGAGNDRAHYLCCAEGAGK